MVEEEVRFGREITVGQGVVKRGEGEI